MSTTATEVRQRIGTRDLGLARDAYSCADEGVSRQLSREAHSLLSSPEERTGASSWLPVSEAGHNEDVHREMILAALDAIILSATTLSLGHTAHWPAGTSIRLSTVLLACWAVYAGGREALESMTYAKYYARERQREAWELDNFPEGEVEEMVQLYEKKGLCEPDARVVVETMAKVPNFFVDVMMLEELQMAAPNAVPPLTKAARVAVCTLVCGEALPLVAALLHRASAGAPGAALSDSTACVLLGVAVAFLGYLGYLRACVTHQGRAKLALQSALLLLPALALGALAGSFGGQLQAAA